MLGKNQSETIVDNVELDEGKVGCLISLRDGFLPICHGVAFSPIAHINLANNFGSIKEFMGFFLKILVLQQCHMNMPFDIRRGFNFLELCLKVFYPIAP